MGSIDVCSLFSETYVPVTDIEPLNTRNCLKQQGQRESGSDGRVQTIFVLLVHAHTRFTRFRLLHPNQFSHTACVMGGDLRRWRSGCRHDAAAAAPKAVFKCSRYQPHYAAHQHCHDIRGGCICSPPFTSRQPATCQSEPGPGRTNSGHSCGQVVVRLE